MKITDHPLWSYLRPFIKVQAYARDGGHKNPRHRLEVLDPQDSQLRRAFLNIEVHCAGCGHLTNPVRLRRGSKNHNHLYLSVACELTVNLACARGRPAHIEVERLVKELSNGEAVHTGPHA